MNKIYTNNLMKYDATCEEHKYSLKKIKGYRFDKNVDLLNELFKGDFCISNDVYEENIEKLVGTGNNLYVKFKKEYYKGVRIIYLVNAFNVYFKRENVSNEYEKDIELTIKWRNIMKEAYPESTYVEDAEKFLTQEFNEDQEELLRNYNEQLENINKHNFGL